MLRTGQVKNRGLVGLSARGWRPPPAHGTTPAEFAAEPCSRLHGEGRGGKGANHRCIEPAYGHSFRMRSAYFMDAIGHAEAFCNRLSATSEAAKQLASAIGVWRKYRSFLQIALDRYRSVNRERKVLIDRLFQEKQADADEIMGKMNSLMALTVYETETVYLFLKILLDRTAETFANYFGLELKKTGKRGGSTHRHLAEKIDAITYPKGLAIDRQLVKHMRALIARVIDYRNDAIEHVAALHPMILATLEVTADGKGEAQIAGAGGRVSESLEVLVGDVDRYMIMMIDCFEANMAKSRCAEKAAETTTESK
jgi:hypothetical protein